MIAADSRYSSSTLTTVVKGNNNVIVITPSAATAYTFNYVMYTTTANDRVEIISNAFYGDPNSWYLIADANPEIMDWSALSAGTVLRIPSAQ
jgi:nucleoid-associated protein YgaU